MAAKVTKPFMSDSKKLALVHISPLIIEDHGDYKMQTNHSGSRCCRLLFSKLYSKSQVKPMYDEIRQLATAKLIPYREIYAVNPTIELSAFIDCLVYLSTVTPN